MRRLLHFLRWLLFNDVPRDPDEPEPDSDEWIRRVNADIDRWKREEWR